MTDEQKPKRTRASLDEQILRQEAATKALRERRAEGMKKRLAEHAAALIEIQQKNAGAPYLPHLANAVRELEAAKTKVPV